MTLTEKVIRRLAGSFVLRNLIIFIILLSSNTGVPLVLGQITLKIILIEATLLANSYGSFLLHNLVLYHYLLKKQRFLLYALSVTALLMGSSWLYRAMKNFFLDEVSDYPWQKWVAMCWVELIYYWAALGIYLAYIYYRDRERLFRVEQEKKELELRQLNEQLNPHFLFNALNNIYSHLLDQSTSGKELILKLSELMRYVLDSSKKSKVPLEEEVAFIEHFIAFEKERLGARCMVDYEVDVREKEACIIPLILFNFIENAFKYGTTAIKPTEISIKISAGNKALDLYVSNEIHKGKKSSTYTGLDNTRKRLELLYPGQYQLEIGEMNNHFTVHLKLSDL